MKQKISVLVFATLVAAVFSCRKSPNFDQLSSNFTVVTNYDANAVFQDYATYYISDTIAYIGGSNSDTILYDNNAKQLVDAVKQNMDARGYTFVAKNAHPDIGINMGAIKVTNTSVIYPGWWWDYPGWWDPWYWGWYYPYYYPWSVAYSITTGTIMIDMIDLKNADAKKTERVIWTAVMGGALGSTSTNVQLAVNAINQAFVQTPEIKAN